KVLFAASDVAGPDVSATVDIYDLTTGTWESAVLSEPRGLYAAASTGDLAFFAGGARSITGQPLYFSDAVDIYDAAADRWTTAHLSQPREQLAAGAAGGYVLFAGGTLAAEGRTVPHSEVVDIY